MNNYEKHIQKYNNKTINVLGTNYKIEIHDEENKFYKENKDTIGYCGEYSKIISVKKLKIEDEQIEENISLFSNTLRHEITHAFFNESGLSSCSSSVESWAENEEMIDWIAIQSPKMFKIFKELEII